MVPNGQGFEAWFPAKPHVQHNTDVVPGGRLRTTLYVLQRGSQVMVVGVTRLPARTRQVAAATLLDAARDGAVKKQQGTVLHESELQQGGWPGRGVRAALPGNLVMQTRFWLKSGVLYQVVTVAPAAESKTADLNRFLKNFYLVPKP